MKSPVKLVGKIRDQFHASSANSDSVNWPEDQAVNFYNPEQNKPITTRCPDLSPRDMNQRNTRGSLHFLLNSSTDVSWHEKMLE